MTKAYSNRALPAGTVLREWRLEEVLGVGGFGIVYKGRGIYFNELVAIKEYFPSSISEREDDDTVVPIDSDAEEVHALGLKKFVEEAKLLWNLSTPTRHPNIVSVRSLFEVHGTAYMVMDFEDGTSLSKALKQGRKFNESSLRAIILPIAEGLERAHRVGVLHRDIKPPNIILNDDGHSVLIDFGSARFESGEATSTKVTFHTPPYAAIEQYVRTFPQGPWTDLYALGVVMYVCITGEKPPEVLERMHGDAGIPLADRKLPGFSRDFLRAIDKAMEVKPDDRPQSISQWMEMLNSRGSDAVQDNEDEEKTRLGSWNTSTPEIVPVAPPAGGFDESEDCEDDGVATSQDGAATSSDAPEDVPEESQEPIKAGARVAVTKQPASTVRTKPEIPGAQTVDEKSVRSEDASAGSAGKSETGTGPTRPEAVDRRPAPKTALLLGGAVAIVALAGVWAMMSGSDPQPDPAFTVGEEIGVSDELAASDGAEAKLSSLSSPATAAAIPENVLSLLDAPYATESEQLDALGKFADGTVAAAAKKVSDARTLRRDQRILAKLEAVRVEGRKITQVTGLAEGISSARNLIAHYSELGRTIEIVSGATKPDVTLAEENNGSPPATLAAASSAIAPSEVTEAAASTDTAVTAATRREFASALASARDTARNVIRLGNRNRPGSNASQDDRENYAIRQGAADAAQDYQKYLDGLEASMRGVTNETEARQSVTKAYQTRAYLRDLQQRAELTLQ